MALSFQLTNFYYSREFSVYLFLERYNSLGQNNLGFFFSPIILQVWFS